MIQFRIKWPSAYEEINGHLSIREYHAISVYGPNVEFIIKIDPDISLRKPSVEGRRIKQSENAGPDH